MSRIPDHVRVDGRRRAVRGSERVRGGTYWLLERLTPPPRERWYVFDAGSRSSRTLLRLPNDAAAAQQVRTLSRLTHDGLPRIERYQRRGGETLLVLPWIAAIDLREYLQRMRRGDVPVLEPYHAVRLYRQMAHALRTLHRDAEVIHADIAPANLLITRKTSRLHLIDFGSAWPIAQTGVRVEGDGTTQPYAAPELRTGRGVNERVDQFALSVVLYELLTGTLPYDGLGGKAGWPEWYDRDNAALPPSRDAWSRRFVPRRLWKRIDALVLRGIALDRDQRYATTAAWLDGVESVYRALEYDRHGIGRRWGLSRVLDWLGGVFAGREGGGGRRE